MATVHFSPNVPKRWRFQLAWVVSSFFKGRIEDLGELLESAQRRHLPMEAAWWRSGYLFLHLKEGERHYFLRCSPE